MPKTQVFKRLGSSCHELIQEHAKRIHIDFYVVGDVTPSDFGCSVARRTFGGGQTATSGIPSDAVIRYLGVDQVRERKGEDEDVVGF